MSALSTTQADAAAVARAASFKSRLFLSLQYLLLFAISVILLVLILSGLLYFGYVFVRTAFPDATSFGACAKDFQAFADCAFVAVKANAGPLYEALYDLLKMLAILGTVLVLWRFLGNADKVQAILNKWKELTDPGGPVFQRLQGMDSKFQNLDGTLKNVDARIQNLDGTLQTLDQKLAGRIDKVQGAQDAIQQTIKEQAEVQQAADEPKWQRYTRYLNAAKQLVRDQFQGDAAGKPRELNYNYRALLGILQAEGRIAPVGVAAMNRLLDFYAQNQRTRDNVTEQQVADMRLQWLAVQEALTPAAP